MPHRTAVALCLLPLATTLSAAPAPVDRMDQVARFYVDAHQFMGSVLVARGDDIVFSKAYGSANLEWNVPNTVDTKFRIGSITKQFTAAAVLLLAERGKLKLDDPIKTYYPDAPAAWDTITLRHLLGHTSGIHNYTDTPDFGRMASWHATPAELVESFMESPGHRKIMLSARFRDAGAGVRSGAPVADMGDDAATLTVVFGRR